MADRLLSEQQVMDELYKYAGVIQMDEEQKKAWTNRRRVQNLADAFQNHGTAPDGSVRHLKDVITSTELKPFVEPAIQYVIVSAMQPRLLISQYLFREIQTQKEILKMGFVGPLKAERIPEGGKYPDISFIMRETGDAINITPSKYGLKIPITDEAIQKSEWDIMAFWFERAGWAMATRKEEEATQLIQEAGHVSFDNGAPAQSQHGCCTGRAISGVQNGTWTLNDLIAQWADLAMVGLTPDTIIMNPLTWAVLMADPELQSVVKQSSIIYEYMPGGSPAPGWPETEHGGFGKYTKAYGNPWPTQGTPEVKGGQDPWSWGLNPVGASFVMRTDIFPGPIRILVTPTVTVDPDGFVNPSQGGQGGGLPDSGTLATTDIIMACSNYCGVLATPYGAGVKFDDWRDPERDIVNVKASAIWGMGILAQGKGINIARRIVIDRNYAFNNVNSVTLDPLAHGTTFAA